jgi:hypothetical protein
MIARRDDALQLLLHFLDLVALDDVLLLEVVEPL